MATKRYIHPVPPRIKLVGLDGKAVHQIDPPKRLGDEPIDLGEMMPITLDDFVIKAVLMANPIFWSDYAHICTATAIRDAFKTYDADPVSSWIELDEADWKILDAAIEKPRHNVGGGQSAEGFGFFNPVLIWQLKPFMDAIRSASTTKPKVVVSSVDESARPAATSVA